MIPGTKPTFPLRFDPQLEYLSADTLKSMSRIWGGKNQPKAVCIRLIREGLANPSAVTAALTGLSPLQRAALALVKERGGAITAGELDASLLAYGYDVPRGPRGFSYQPTSEVATQLCNAGLLMPLIAANYAGYFASLSFHGGLPLESVVFCDDRLLARVDWAVTVTTLPVTASAEQPGETTLRRAPHVMLDIMTLLQKLAEMGGLQLTKSFTIRVADERMFRKKMGWGDDQVFDGHAFPDTTGAFLQALQAVSLLQVVDNTLLLRVSPEQFAARPLPEQVAALATGFIIQPDWRELETYHDLRQSRTALFHALRALPVGEGYYRLTDFLAALYDRIGETVQTNFYQPKPTRYDFGRNVNNLNEDIVAWREQHRPQWLVQEAPFFTKALESWLYWLGIVELGTDASGDLLFRLTDLGRQLFHGEQAQPAASTETPTAGGAAWVVQPNFDLVVYLDAVSAAQLTFLELHAERSQSDRHTAHYVLTRDSVYRGLETGTTVDALIATLQAGAQAALPQNVEREIREWANTREQMTIHAQTRLIEFPSSETRELALQAGLQGTLIGDCFIRAEPGAQIKAALKSVFGQHTIPTVDYALPPTPCLEIHEDGTLTLVANTHDLLIEAQLAHSAEPAGEKRYRLTRESLQRLRQAGVNAKQFLTFLELRSRNEIPPLLEVAVRSALGEKTTVQADLAYVLHIKDKKLYAALSESPLLKPYILDIPGPDTIVVSQAKLDEFKEHLAWLGITLAPYAPHVVRPDWQQTVRDAKTQQKRRRDWW